MPVLYRESKVYYIMERVETLLKKLQEQFAQKAPPGQLLLTVQMLQAELIHLQKAALPDLSNLNVAVTVSQNTFVHHREENEKKDPGNTKDEKIYEVLQVDEAEIEAELEALKQKAENIKKISVQNKPAILFEPFEDDIPTLSHQQRTVKPVAIPKEINETASSGSSSLNEKLKQSSIDLGDTLTEQPIRDLKKAIGVNDRYLFINELFRGDEAVYERSIKTINSFSILAEAEYWIQRELKVKNGWTDINPLVKQFYQLVKRRFS